MKLIHLAFACIVLSSPSILLPTKDELQITSPQSLSSPPHAPIIAIIPPTPLPDPQKNIHDILRDNDYVALERLLRTGFPIEEALRLAVINRLMNGKLCNNDAALKNILYIIAYGQCHCADLFNIDFDNGWCLQQANAAKHVDKDDVALCAYLVQHGASTGRLTDAEKLRYVSYNTQFSLPSWLFTLLLREVLQHDSLRNALKEQLQIQSSSYNLCVEDEITRLLLQRLQYHLHKVQYEKNFILHKPLTPADKQRFQGIIECLIDAVATELLQENSATHA